MSRHIPTGRRALAALCCALLTATGSLACGPDTEARWDEFLDESDPERQEAQETAKQQGVARVAPEAASFMQIAVTAHVHRMLAARAYNGAVPHGAFATWMWPPSQRTPVGAPDFSMYDAPPP